MHPLLTHRDLVGGVDWLAIAKPGPVLQVAFHARSSLFSEILFQEIFYSSSSFHDG